ncbi:MAG TPA: M56 family metallopeptidase [Sedimentisphaerales bacterium]|nr:M56 family metallopeptidase [Sedimentisphaerales bacterium]
MTSLTQMLVDLPLPVSILLKITVVLAAGWILHLLLARRNPRWRALMWRGVIVGILAIPLLVPLRYLQIPVTSARPVHSQRAADAHNEAELTDIENSRSHLTATAPSPPLEDMSISHPSLSISTWAQEHLWTIVFCAWLFVGVLMATHFLAVFVRIRKKIKSSLSAPEHLRQLLQKVAHDLGCTQSVALRYSSDFTAPFLAGFRKPLIVLPERMTHREYSAELPAIFAHELAHLGSRDLLWLFAARCLGVLMWFHPLVWKLREALSTACEQVCDAVAADYVGGADSYCGTLARLTLEINGTVPIVGGIPIVRSCQIIRRLAILKRQIYSLPLAGYRVVPSLLIGFAGLAAIGGLSLVYAENPATSNAETRVVHFPADRSLGKLMMQDVTTARHVDTFYYWETDFNWEYLSQALGDVSVPAGKRLWLIIYGQSEWSDLSPLSNLRPDDLYRISLSGSYDGGPNPNDKCMPHIAGLAGLKVLDLVNTDITSGGLRHIKQIKSLERLTVPDLISNVGLAHIAEITSLKGLYLVAYADLTKSMVTNAGLRCLAKLTSLEELSLGGGHLGDAGLQHLEKLPSLRYLMLWGDTFTDAGMAHLKNIPSLRTLHLGHLHQLTDVALLHLSEIPNLENLSLHWADGITDEGVAQLKKMTSLRRLDIGRSQVTDAGLAHLAQIKSLEYLILPHDGITDKGFVYLAELDKLKHLNVARAHYVDPNMDKDFYTDEALRQLSKLQSLEELTIGSIGITDAGMDEIAKLSKLRTLWLFGCPISDKGLSKLTALKSLQSLDFSSSETSISGLGQLNVMPNITNLNVRQLKRDNNDNGVLDIAGLTDLRKLAITLDGDAIFEDEDFACLANLKDLQWLQLWPTHLSDAGMAHLRALTNIERLNIGGPALTDDGLKCLANMKKLNHLTISDGRFTDEGLRRLEGLKALGYLRFDFEAGFSPQALASLRNKLPSLAMLYVGREDKRYYGGSIATAQKATTKRGGSRQGTSRSRARPAGPR